MAYRPRYISISAALDTLKLRGISAAEENVLEALRDGALTARGLVSAATANQRAATGDIPVNWWWHINSSLNDIVWFDLVETLPPTRFRAENISILAREFEKIWPKSGEKRGPKSKVLQDTIREPLIKSLARVYLA